MAIRISGINSGLDTDSIVAELVKASSTKKETLEKEQTKLSWKQDAWKSLNTKIYSFFSKSLSNMRYESSFNKKTTTVADSSVATVIAGDSAVNGTQTLAVKQLAKAGYLTGAKLSDTSAYTSSTTMATLGAVAEGETASIKIKVGTAAETSISIASTDTISSVVSKMEAKGLNASFDATNQRLFLSVDDSGASSDFSISGGDTNGTEALYSLGLAIDADNPKATGKEMVRVKGQDAIISLNGADFTSSTNTFTVNGLTITAQEVTGNATDGYTETSINTSNDVDGIYDMIKDFFTEYNSLVIEMDSLYNADSSSGYEPLTDEEKDAMTDTQIEDWEDKIKDALLRKDSTLGTVTTMMKQVMMQGVTIDGETVTLDDFGIETESYFNAADNEKGAYHIDGDSEDSVSSGNKDKLKSAIASDATAVSAFFSKLATTLYDKLNEKMKSTEYRSVYKVYDDKKMQADYDDYTDEIEEAEEKLTALEDRYYDQFSAMEVALSKINSSQSAISSLLA